MRLTLLLNRGAGMLRGRDAAALAAELATIFDEAGHETEWVLTESDRCIATIGRLFETGGFDAIVVGGGDGTISAAAGFAARSGAALGVLPLGTMNLFARMLRLPLEARAAATALAASEIVPVDVSEVDGRVFVHHLTFGLHARVIELRERRGYRSRPGKVWGNIRAFFQVLRRPPLIDARLTVDGRAFHVNTAAILVANNPLGEGHLPYPDNPRQGRLAVYVGRSRRSADLLQLAADLALGDIADNPLLEQHSGAEVTVETGRPTIEASLDGELVRLPTPVRIRIRPGGLKVLQPVQGEPG